MKRKTKFKIFIAYALCVLMAVLLNMCMSYWQQTKMDSSTYISDSEAMRYGAESMVWTLLTYGGIGFWLPRAISKGLREDDEAERPIAEASKNVQTKDKNALDCEVMADTTEPEKEIMPPGQVPKTAGTEQESDSAIESCESGLEEASKDIPSLYEPASDDQKHGKYAFERSEYVFRPREAPKKRDVIISGAWVAFAVAPIILSIVFVLVLLVKGGEADISQSGDPQIQQEQAETAEQEFNREPEPTVETVQEMDEIEALATRRFIEDQALKKAKENEAKYGLFAHGGRRNLIPMPETKFEKDADYTPKERIPTISNVKEPNADAEHGEILVKPAYECVCPFTVETLSTGESYYIRLRYIEPGFNAEQKDTRNRVSQGDQDDIAVFCTGGKVEIDVPPGNYRLWYCSGDDWKGTDTYFGDDTVWYVSDDLLEFSVGLEYVYGNTVTLYPVLNGDFDTRVVDPDEIPEDF